MQNHRILMFVGDIYEDLELWYPKLRLIEAGAEVVIAGPEASTQYQGKNGYPCQSDISISDVDASQYTGLVVLQGKGGGFAGNLPAGATGASSAGHGVFRVRAAALNHEVLDHTMEVKSVVVAHLDQFDEIGDGVGGTAVEEVDGDVACAGFHENLHA